LLEASAPFNLQIENNLFYNDEKNEADNPSHRKDSLTEQITKNTENVFK